MLTWMRNNVAATVVFAVVLVLTMAGSATAGHLLTGKDIKDGSLTGKDVKDGSLAADDLAPGTLSGLQGAPGAPGAPGASFPGSACTVPAQGTGSITVTTAANGVVTLACTLPATNAQDLDVDQDGYRRSQDCNDTKAAVHPGVVEVAGNRIDDDCDGLADENGVTPSTDTGDADFDGITLASDCDDTNPAVWTGHPDTFGDGIDNDCNGHDG